MGISGVLWADVHWDGLSPSLPSARGANTHLHANKHTRRGTKPERDGQRERERGREMETYIHAWMMASFVNIALRESEGSDHQV